MPAIKSSVLLGEAHYVPFTPIGYHRYQTHEGITMEIKVNRSIISVLVFVVSYAVFGSALAQEQRFKAKGVKMEYLDGKTYQKKGYAEVKEFKSKIALPKVIWSSEENVLEDQAMASKRTKKILASDKVHPELKRIHKIMKPRIYKLNERIYEPYGFEMTNNTIIVGDTGLIIFDTNYSNEFGKVVLKAFREATGNTMDVHTIIYSHHYPDQLSGTAAYVSPEAVARGEINVIAHDALCKSDA